MRKENSPTIVFTVGVFSLYFIVTVTAVSINTTHVETAFDHLRQAAAKYRYFAIRNKAQAYTEQATRTDLFYFSARSNVARRCFIVIPNKRRMGTNSIVIL